MKKSLLALVAVTLAATVALATGGVGQPKQAPPPFRDFKDKVVAVSCRPPAQGAILDNVEVKLLGNRFFLVGKGPADSDTKVRFGDAAIWLCVDDVSMIAVFDNVEQAKRALDNK